MSCGRKSGRISLEILMGVIITIVAIYLTMRFILGVLGF